MKKIFVFITVLALLAASIQINAFAAYPTEDIDVKSEAVYMVNVDTDVVIFEENSDKRMYPASTTKIMTALIALECCTDLTGTKVVISQSVIDEIRNTDSSLAGLYAGEEISMLDMLYYLLLPSGNEAALAIAHHIGNGDVDAFVQMMNERAVELGCTGTHFANPHGLHDENHYTTARDMYLIAREAMENEQFADVVGTLEYETYPTNKSGKRKLVNTNSLINPYRESYYPYAKGIKTGYTEKAGYCLVSTATKNGYTYMLVLMNAPTKDINGRRISVSPCFKDSRSLYTWCFDKLGLKEVVSSEEIIAEVPLELAWNRDYISLSPQSAYKTILPLGVNTSSVLIEVKTEESVTAPVEKGTVLGKAVFKYANEVVGEVDLIATEDVERSNLLFTLKIIEDIIKSKIFICIFAAILIFLAIYAIMLFRNRTDRRGGARGMKRYR